MDNFVHFYYTYLKPLSNFLAYAHTFAYNYHVKGNEIWKKLI